MSLPVSGFPDAAQFWPRLYPHQNEFLPQSLPEPASACASVQTPVDEPQSMCPVPFAEQDLAVHPQNNGPAVGLYLPCYSWSYSQFIIMDKIMAATVTNSAPCAATYARSSLIAFVIWFSTVFSDTSNFSAISRYFNP